MRSDPPAPQDGSVGVGVKSGVALALLALIAFGLRLAPVFAFPSIDYPDEIFQTIEQAHRLAFGYGVVPWEFELWVAKLDAARRARRSDRIVAAVRRRAGRLHPVRRRGPGRAVRRGDAVRRALGASLLRPDGNVGRGAGPGGLPRRRLFRPPHAQRSGRRPCPGHRPLPRRAGGRGGRTVAHRPRRASPRPGRDVAHPVGAGRRGDHRLAGRRRLPPPPAAAARRGGDRGPDRAARSTP